MRRVLPSLLLIVLTFAPSSFAAAQATAPATSPTTAAMTLATKQIEITLRGSHQLRRPAPADCCGCSAPFAEGGRRRSDRKDESAVPGQGTSIDWPEKMNVHVKFVLVADVAADAVTVELASA
jgi:hypothetical protein